MTAPVFAPATPNERASSALPGWGISRSTRLVFEGTNRAILCVLIVALLVAIASLVVATGLDVRLVWTAGIHEGVKHVLVAALATLALVEVFRTAMAYIAEGRVKVTYIIDAVLVTVLTEVLGFWFKDFDGVRMTNLIVLVLALTLARVMAIHFSPNRSETADGL